jgi:predicted aspartyl protease
VQELPSHDVSRECGRRLLRLAHRLAFSVSLLASASALQAQQPPADPAATDIKFTARFVPRDQRHPASYELANGTATIKALVNGREVWVMLDNGASMTLIDEAFARSLGLQTVPLAGAGLFTATGRLERSRVTERVDIVIPGQVSMQAPVVAANLAGVSAITDRPISLVLGKEYFKVMLFMFIPRSREVHLRASGSLQIRADTPYLVLQDESPQIEVMIDGRPVVLTIDLGFNGQIALSQHAWSRLGMGDSPTMASRVIDARGSATSTVTATVDEVSLGSRHTKDVKVSLSPALLVERDGFIGLGLLSRFNFALDIKARRLWLIPPFSEE